MPPPRLRLVRSNRNLSPCGRKFVQSHRNWDDLQERADVVRAGFERLAMLAPGAAVVIEGMIDDYLGDVARDLEHKQ